MSDWKEGLPDELKVNPAIKDFKDVPALVESYIQTKGMVGSSVRPPGPDAAPEEKAEFVKKLSEKIPGLRYRPPAEWADYEPPMDAKVYASLEVPEGVQLDKDAFSAAAKELGLTVAQAKKFLQAEAQKQAAQKNAAQEADAALRRELGAAYEERVTAAKAVALKMGVPEAELASLSTTQLKAWMATAQRFGGEGRELGTQEGGQASGVPTPQEALAQIEEIQRRPEYFNPRAGPATHQQLKAKVQQLLRYAYPEQFKAA